MITKEDAISANNFHHITAKNADGTPQRFRRNGATKTWKTRPTEFRIPVKRGMSETGYIDHNNAAEFAVGYEDQYHAI